MKRLRTTILACALVMTMSLLYAADPASSESVHDVAVPDAGQIIAGASAESDKITTAREAFINMPGDIAELLTRQMREDMMMYYDADTIRAIYNNLGGMSKLQRPVTDNYLKCVISPVSTITIKVLPYKGSKIIAAVYTIDNPGMAADSQIMFYDERMRPLKVDKHIRLARIQDFMHKMDHDQSKDLMSLIPFPMIEYTLLPETDDLNACLTSMEYIGIEDAERLSPHIKPGIIYRWNGKKYVMEK